MVSGALIVEHDVVAVRDAHEVVAAGRGEQDGQVLDVVLIGFHVVGVARVAPHGDARELAHEVVLQPGTDDLAAVVEVLRTDKADHRIDDEGRKPLGESVAAGLHRHLVRPEVSVGRQLRTLPRLEVHEVGPHTHPLVRRQVPGLGDHGPRDAEGLVALLGARDALKDQVGWRPMAHGIHLRGDVG